MEHREQQGTWISTGCSKTSLRVALLVCRLMQAACSVSAQGTVSGAICPPLQPVTRTEALLQQPLAAEAAPRRPVLPDVLPKLLWPCCLRPQERLGEGAGLGACGPCMCAEMILVSPSSQAWRKHSLELWERLPVLPPGLRGFCSALWLLFWRSFWCRMSPPAPRQVR